MPGKAQVFAGMAETTATDIEPAGPGSDGGDDEDKHECSQNKYAAAIKNARNQSEAGEDFEPGEEQREPDAELPWKRFVIVDVSRELDRIDHLDRAGVNEQCANQNRYDAQRDARKGGRRKAEG